MVERWSSGQKAVKAKWVTEDCSALWPGVKTVAHCTLFCQSKGTDWWHLATFLIIQHHDLLSLARAESANEITALLQGLGKGVGQKTAELIVECYGKKTLDVLDLPPKEAVRKLREIKGIGATKAKNIKELWDNNAARQVRRERVWKCGKCGCGVIAGLLGCGRASGGGPVSRS